jgi:hypothetical protein
MDVAMTNLMISRSVYASVFYKPLCRINQTEVPLASAVCRFLLAQSNSVITTSKGPKHLCRYNRVSL